LASSAVIAPKALLKGAKGSDAVTHAYASEELFEFLSAFLPKAPAEPVQAAVDTAEDVPWPPDDTWTLWTHRPPDPGSRIECTRRHINVWVWSVDDVSPRTNIAGLYWRYLREKAPASPPDQGQDQSAPMKQDDTEAQRQSWLRGEMAMDESVAGVAQEAKPERESLVDAFNAYARALGAMTADEANYRRFMWLLNELDERGA